MSLAQRIAAAGIELRLTVDGRLLVGGSLTAEQAEYLRNHKAELVAELFARWPFKSGADEPRCDSCRRWWATGKSWPKTGEAIGDCLRHNFETLAGDNCKSHSPQQGSALRPAP